MARTSDDLNAGGPAQHAGQNILTAEHGAVRVPSDAFITQADMVRDGSDLVLKTHGDSVTIKGYFSSVDHPGITGPSGVMLKPAMVDSFVHHEGPAQYAGNATANDASAVGAVREVHGHATVRHTDGTTEVIVVGTAIHEGDVIETDATGAVNIAFRDNSSFAVSHNAKLAIDEYVFDPHSDAGASNFSMLRGVFVYTSGLIGHADPDDVHIHTPAGSIGIRGTVIAGNVDSGQVTVVEGAIVVTSNNGEQVTLSNQYETAQIDAQSGHVASIGTLSAGDIGTAYSSLGSVAPAFFSGLGVAPDNGQPATDAGHGAAPDAGHTDAPAPAGNAPADSGHGAQAAPDNTAPATADAAPPASFADTSGIGTTGDTFGAGANVFSSTGSGTTFLGSGANTGSGSAGTADGTAMAAGVAPGALAPAAAPVDTTTAASGSTAGAVTPPPVGTTFPDNAPVAANDFFGTTNQNTTMPAGIFSVLTNDTDSDVGDTISVIAGGGAGSAGGTFTVDAAGIVAFDPGTSFLYLAAGANATTSYTYTVADSHGAQSQGSVSVTVTGLNDAPTVSTPATLSLAENTTNVTVLTAADPDTGDVITWAIGGADAALFTLNTTTGQLSANAAFNYEISPLTYNITVTATDAGGLNSTRAITINLTNVNEGPTVTSGATYNLNEGATTVGTATATDPDAGDTITWSLSGADAALFTINATTGAIAANASFDYETQANIYNMNVVATDAGGLTSTRAITVNINNVTPTVDINTAGGATQGSVAALSTAVLHTTDPNTANAGLTYTVTTGTAHGYLALSSAPGTPITSFTQAQLAAGQVIYHNNGDAAANDTFIFTVSDGASASGAQTFTFNVSAAAALSLNTIGAGAGFTITDSNSEGFGSSAAAVGDLNGDGFGDIIMVKNQNAAGLYFELHGQAGTYGNLSIPGGAPITALNAGLPGPLVNDMQVAAIGNFGTGGPYFIVSSPASDSPGPSSSSGDASIINASGTVVERFTGLNLDQFGQSVAGIGDVNGDGYDDVLIGAPTTSFSALDSGSAYLLFGNHITATLDLSGAPSPSVGFRIDGAAANNHLGMNVAGAGDFNNDGYSDFMVSSPSANKIDLYFGSPTNPTATHITITGPGADTSYGLMNMGDQNNDGFSDIALFSKGASTIAGFSGSATPGNMTMANASYVIHTTGGYNITAGNAVGDFNGDGHTDLGVVVTSTGSPNVADIYVVYGGTIPGGTMDQTWLANPNNAFHMTYTAATAAELNNMTITSAGDLNGDGFGDVIIGLPAVDTNGGAASTDGESIVVYGQKAGPGAIVTDNSGLDGNGAAGTVAASANGQSLVGTAGNDTLDGGAFTGINFSAGSGNDVISLSGSSFGTINGGGGTDKIAYMSGGTLDFTGLNAARITHIEKLDMAGTGQTLKLDIHNIFSMMESSDNGNLVIGSSGSTGNTLSLDNLGGGAQAGANAATIQTLLGATGALINGSNIDFQFSGGHTLSIDNNLITGGHVNVV